MKGEIMKGKIMKNKVNVVKLGDCKIGDIIQLVPKECYNRKDIVKIGSVLSNSEYDWISKHSGMEKGLVISKSKNRTKVFCFANIPGDMKDDIYGYKNNTGVCKLTYSVKFASEFTY